MSPGRIQVDRRTVSEQVADALRERILSGEYRPGQRLNEANLAETLGVSHGPIREAFRQLAGEGLLTYQPGRGMSVWQPTSHELWELLTLRAGIEGMAVRLALEAGRRAGLVTSLRQVLEAMAAAEARDDWPAAARLDGQFHAAIVGHGGNRRIRQLWAGTHPAVWLASLPALFPQYQPPLTPRHATLLAVIADGTPAAAHEAVVQHIQQFIGETIVPDEAISLEPPKGWDGSPTASTPDER